MTQPSRGAALCGVYIVVALALLGAGLLSGGLVLVALGGLTALLAVVVVLQPSLERLALWLTCIFAFTTSWQVVAVGPLRPSDLCFAGGLVLFAAAAAGIPDRWPLIPAFALQLALVIVVVAALNAVVPFDPGYLAHRVFLDSSGYPSVQTQSNLGITAKWLIGILGTSAIVGFAVRARPSAVYRIATAYAAGAALNGFVAVSDRLHLTHIGPQLLGVTYGTRQTALTLHPNHLAEACTLGVPIACWLAARHTGGRRVLGLACLAGTLSGVYLSGSRGGAVVAAVAVVAAFALLRELRVRIAQLVGVVALAGLAVLLAFPGLAGTVADTTRLTPSASTAFSDEARDALAAQASQDFHASPIYGNGLQLALSSHDIYRQSLAAGGIVLLASFACFLMLSLLSAVRFARFDQLGVAAAVTIAAFIVLGAAENFLTDRYLYVPFALAFAGSALAGRPADADEQSSEPSAVSAGAVADPTLDGTAPAVPVTTG